jgi:hypothetical protein
MNKTFFIIFYLILSDARCPLISLQISNSTFLLQFINDFFHSMIEIVKTCKLVYKETFIYFAFLFSKPTCPT